MDSVAYLPDGGRVVVEGEAQDIARRVREGDPTKGWAGDPDMRVFVVPYEGVRSGEVRFMFEFWTLDAHRNPYLALASETCGPEVIDRLILGDTTRRDVIGDALRRQAKFEAEQKLALGERHEEMADRLAFALLRENAAHFGGKGGLIPVTDRPNRATRRGRR